MIVLVVRRPLADRKRCMVALDGHGCGGVHLVVFPDERGRRVRGHLPVFDGRAVVAG